MGYLDTVIAERIRPWDGHVWANHKTWRIGGRHGCIGYGTPSERQPGDHHCPSLGIRIIQVLSKSLSLTSTVYFTQLCLLNHSPSCLGVLGQCCVISFQQGVSTIQPFTHRSQLVRWMQRSVQCRGDLLHLPFKQGVSHQQQMVNSASFLSKCTMEAVRQLTHFSEPSDTNSVSFNLNFNLNSHLVFNLKWHKQVF